MTRKTYNSDSARILASKHNLKISDIPTNNINNKVIIQDVKNFIDYKNKFIRNYNIQLIIEPTIINIFDKHITINYESIIHIKSCWVKKFKYISKSYDISKFKVNQILYNKKYCLELIINLKNFNSNNLKNLINLIICPYDESKYTNIPIASNGDIINVNLVNRSIEII